MGTVSSSSIAVLNTDLAGEERIIEDIINMGAYEKSIEYTTEALESFKKLKNEQGIGFAYSNLGNCYHYLGKYEEGIKYNLKAIYYAEKVISFIEGRWKLLRGGRES